ncbi:MAG: hypothetical protein ACREIR_12205 [Geminicoccaceae bacterium]
MVRDYVALDAQRPEKVRSKFQNLLEAGTSRICNISGMRRACDVVIRMSSGAGRGRDTSRPNICAGRAPNQGGTTSSITYELFTLKYAHHNCPTADNFVFRDGVYDRPGLSISWSERRSRPGAAS